MKGVRIMTIVETLHRFCAEMSFGYDPGFTQMWLTREIYRKLKAEMLHCDAEYVDDASFEPFIMFEGRRIFCADK